jgi:hypothetical protein
MHHWLQDDKEKDIGGYDSTREGAKGDKYFYYILFTHLGFSWEKWLHELLGEATWCIIACNYINHVFGHLGVHSMFLNHCYCSSFILAHSCSWFWHGK